MGRLFVVILGFLIVILVTSLIFTYIMFKKRKILFPRFVLFILDTLHTPSMKLVSFFNGNEEMVDLVSIEIRNILFRDSFARIPYKDRVAIFPQCLRSLGCPARLSNIKGIECVGCGKCVLNKFREKCDKLGYKGFYIVPGGGFVKRIVRDIKPMAALGVACEWELNEAMLYLSQRIPVQGVPLSKAGCINTEVDVDRVLEALSMKENHRIT